VKPWAFPLCDGDVRLRLIERSDLESLRRWRNRVDVRTRFFSTDIITEEQQLKWWQSYADADDDWFYIVEVLDPDLGPRPAGAIALYHYDRSARAAEYGRLMIGEDWARGRGLARTASRLLLDYSFRHLGLSSIHLEVLRDNTPALRLYESLGFHQEGEASRPTAIRMAAPFAESSAHSADAAQQAPRSMRQLWNDVVGPWQPSRLPSPAVSLLVVTNAVGDVNVLVGLERLRTQSFKDFEVLVLDDGCAETAAIAETAQSDPRFVHVRFSAPCSSRAARLNQGALLSRGRRVAVLKVHDLSAANCLAGRLEEMERLRADLLTWSEHGLLARWRVFLTVGMFDPHPLVEVRFVHDLWQRAVRDGLACVNRRPEIAAPTISEAGRRHLACNRNASLRPDAILDYTFPVPPGMWSQT
jgi:RimJ/RimL family protein N-acetyltransferase